MDSESIMTGDEFDRLSDNEAQITVENTAIFAELSPRQKSRIISVLRSNGHTVGFLGDGVNDIPAVLEADVGISVNNASPSVKEAADVILLKKDLNVLESGIREGRRAFANMSKYIKITASSNLGNIIAIVFASVFLPFFPMTSIQILLLNMLYDILCLVLPWDRVDDDICRKPLRWSGHTLSRFMMYFGPVSSVFDILTFAFLFFFMCPHMCGGSFFSLAPAMQSRFITIFQTGWFIESMWTQILIIHLLRTSGLPFIHSRPAYAVTGVTMAGILVFTVLTVTPPGKAAGLTGLPPVYFLFLVVTVICYLLIMTVVKRVYIRKYNELI